VEFEQDRVDKTREGLDLILKLWTQEKVDFKGKHYHANGAVLDPKPAQKPHPPLLFAGIGPRMLRMAGEYADICLIPGFPGVDNAKSRKIVMDEAHRRQRTGKISMADMGAFPKESGVEVRTTGYQKHVEAASEAGSSIRYAVSSHKLPGLTLGFCRDIPSTTLMVSAKIQE